MAGPKVVIIGGGSGGVHCAIHLHGSADVSVIDEKDFYELVPATIRAPIDPATLKRVCIPYASIPKLGTLVQGRAADVTKDAVILADGRSIPYDHLVIATGSSYPEPVFKGGALKLSDKHVLAEATAAKVAAAKKVLVIGGGPVGIEVTAEILVAHPGKDVTLVTGASRLLDTKAPALGANCEAFIERNGGKVITGQKVSEVSGGKYKLTPSGEEIEADLVFKCYAGIPHTDFLKKHPAVLDERGYVKVDSQFRVQNAPASWFAVGDVTNTPGVKLHYLANMQGALLAGNIKAVIKQGPDAKLKPWTKNGMGFEAMFISLGPRAGTGHLGWLTIPSFLVAMIKSRDLFVGKGRHEVGVK